MLYGIYRLSSKSWYVSVSVTFQWDWNNQLALLVLHTTASDPAHRSICETPQLVGEIEKFTALTWSGFCPGSCEKRLSSSPPPDFTSTLSPATSWAEPGQNFSRGKSLICLAYYKENEKWVGAAAPHSLYTASALDGMPLPSPTSSGGSAFAVRFRLFPRAHSEHAMAMRRGA
jgi:hypothetical protein